MNKDNIVFRIEAFGFVEAVADGGMAIFATFDDGSKFGNVELFGVGFEDVLPAVETGDNNMVNFGMFFKDFKRVDDRRFVFDTEKLFWDVLSHA